MNVPVSREADLEIGRYLINVGADHDDLVALAGTLGMPLAVLEISIRHARFEMSA
jgi:thiamine monophosphate kinase